MSQHFRKIQNCCWWKTSQTTIWDVRNPVHNEIFSISTGGCWISEPSTVFPSNISGTLWSTSPGNAHGTTPHSYLGDLSMVSWWWVPMQTTRNASWQVTRNLDKRRSFSFPTNIFQGYLSLTGCSGWWLTILTILGIFPWWLVLEANVGGWPS